MLWADISDKSEGRKKKCTRIIEFIIKKKKTQTQELCMILQNKRRKGEVEGGKQKEKKICQEFSHWIQNASVSRDTETS